MLRLTCHFCIYYPQVTVNYLVYILFQRLSKAINETCPDEQMTCLLSRKINSRNGIEVCFESSVKTNPCPAVLLSEQRICDEFYIITLNCSLVQPQETTTMTSSNTQTNLIQETNEGMFLIRIKGFYQCNTTTCMIREKATCVQ